MKFFSPVFTATLTLLALFPFCTAFATSVTLAWNPPNDSRVVGYIVNWGSESRTYTRSSGVLSRYQTEFTVTGLSETVPTYFSVVSVDAKDEPSDFSNEAAQPWIASPTDGFTALYGPCGWTHLSGTSAAESQVSLFADNVSVGEAVADQDGRWETYVDLSPAGEGSLTLFARSTGADSPMVAGWAKIQEAGDLDRSGDLGLGDAVVILKLLTGLGATEGLTSACEVTGDGRIGLPDAVYLLQRTAGLR